MFRRKLFTLLALLIAIVVVTACMSQDALDQQALHKQFDIPNDWQMISYEGFPSRAGFGQREGLRVGAVFQLTAAQSDEFKKQSVGRGWQTLPISQAIVDKIPYQGLKVPLDAQNGFYLCKTAGDNALNATTTRPCADVAKLNDIILGVLDLSTNQLSVVVKASY